MHVKLPVPRSRRRGGWSSLVAHFSVDLSEVDLILLPGDLHNGLVPVWSTWVEFLSGRVVGLACEGDRHRSRINTALLHNRPAPCVVVLLRYLVCWAHLVRSRWNPDMGSSAASIAQPSKRSIAACRSKDISSNMQHVGAKSGREK